MEVGANEPQAGSQTWFLEERGWQGILVEPQSQLCERLRQARLRSKVFEVACSGPGHPEKMPLYVPESHCKSSLVKNLVDASTKYIQTEMVKIMTLDAVLKEAGSPAVNFVSIDVEGTQLDVLHGFTLSHHQPDLLLIEDHLHHLKVHCYLKRQGYRLVKRTGLNNWYVTKDRPFALATSGERLRLWKKIWCNTPFRKLRVFVKRRRAARQMVAADAKKKGPDNERG